MKVKTKRIFPDELYQVLLGANLPYHAHMIADAREQDLSVIDLKATEDGYALYQSVGFEDDHSKYHLMKWKNA